LGSGPTNPSAKNSDARQYDPTTGRFISIDPIIDYNDPQQIHGYSYANNNPTTGSDPDGLKVCLEECGSKDDQVFQEQIRESRKKERAAYETRRSFECRRMGECGRYGYASQVRRQPAQPASPAPGFMQQAGAFFSETGHRISTAGQYTWDSMGRRLGNSGVGSGTRAEADMMGRAWVGPDYTVSGGGSILISKDKLRQYRSPSYKPNRPEKFGGPGYQANFEWRTRDRGRWQGEAHLNITDMP
jgi:hypothetical protein